MAKPRIVLPRLTPQQIERFWTKVDKSPGQGPNGECWEWTAYRNRDGYGKLALTKRTVTAPRLAYYLATGQDPAALDVLHHCDNPPCVRPEHLFLGTQIENQLDSVDKGRAHRSRGDEHWTRRHPERLAHGDTHPARLHPEYQRRGESHGMSKFTEQDIRDIRAAYKGKYGSLSALARKYGCTHGTIRLIVLRRTWSHVD